ncbi:Rv0361 family membrane protein [Nocardia sp. NPDC055321]
MSEDADQPERIDQRESRTMLPFLIAIGVTVVVIIGIVVSALLSPAEKNVTDKDRLAKSARNFIESRSGTDALDPSTACPGFDEQRSPLRTETGEKAGKSTLVKLTDPNVQGDRATAQVTWRADDRDSTSTWTFTKTDGAWLVCNS